MLMVGLVLPMILLTLATLLGRESILMERVEMDIQEGRLHIGNRLQPQQLWWN
jgi:hypothetical protein